jgi:hypothetical protein
MSEYQDRMDRLEATTDVVTDNLDISRERSEEMNRNLAEASRQLQGMERQISGGIKRAFDGVVFDGKSLSDALRTVTNSVIRSTYNSAMRPVTDHLGGLLTKGLSSILPFADGGAFTSGRVTPFANGGVVGGPTYFPMRGGTGLMGEAGPEAIMPLTRGADGKLGVRSAGGGGGNTIVMNISTPDVASFNRSRTQIAAQMSRALGRSERNT